MCEHIYTEDIQLQQSFPYRFPESDRLSIELVCILRDKTLNNLDDQERTIYKW
jgi:hypothetical protein